MALTPRLYRQKQINSLCTEIDRLILCHRSLPPGAIRDDVEDEVSARLNLINDLKRPGFLESSGSRQAAYLISLFLVVCGLMTGTYAAIGLGAFVAFITIVASDTP